MIKVSMGLHLLQETLGGGFGTLLDFLKVAERRGLDMVSAHDHVALGSFDSAEYPAPSGLPGKHDDPWMESITLLAAIAGATTRLRLSTAVMVGPLRPAVLLAKQLATLDHVSNGRALIGLGAGWQRAEFQASGVRFEDRFSYLDEQVQACRALWRDTPASFEGRLIRFKDLIISPKPVQSGGVPLWLGVLPTEHGLKRIGRLADGWFAMHHTPAELTAIIAQIHASLQANGRDTAGFPIHVELPPVYKPDGMPDFDAIFAPARAYIDAGATIISVMPSRYCRNLREVEALLDRLVALKTPSGMKPVFV